MRVPPRSQQVLCRVFLCPRPGRALSFDEHARPPLVSAPLGSPYRRTLSSSGRFLPHFCPLMLRLRLTFASLRETLRQQRRPGLAAVSHLELVLLLLLQIVFAPVRGQPLPQLFWLHARVQPLADDMFPPFPALIVPVLPVFYITLLQRDALVQRLFHSRQRVPSGIGPPVTQSAIGPGSAYPDSTTQLSAAAGLSLALLATVHLSSRSPLSQRASTP